MKVDDDGNLFFDSSERVETPNRGIVGIDTEGVVSQGYDGGMDADTMTPAERRELAEEMIRRWKRFGGLE